jgi:hypothetical protein
MTGTHHHTQLFPWRMRFCDFFLAHADPGKPQSSKFQPPK